MKHVMCLASALALLLTPAIAGPIGTPYKVVRSGMTAEMGLHYALANDCRSRGAVSINLLRAPHSGDVLIGARRAHPTFAPGSAYARCNARLVEGTQVYYRPNPGYTGSDHYIVERVFPNGNAQMYWVTIVVR